MINELIERSPIRIFEKSVSGGLGAGHIGVVTSKEGVGKTAFLVQLGLDKMLQDKHIVHISFSDKVDHILGWYQNLFMELSASKKIENPLSVYDNICKNRIILNFNSEKISVVDSLKKVELLISDARYNVDSIYFDGITVGMLKKEDFAALRQFAQTLNLEVWLSLTVKQYDENGIAPSVRVCRRNRRLNRYSLQRRSHSAGSGKRPRRRVSAEHAAEIGSVNFSPEKE